MMEWSVAGGAALGAALLLMFLSVPVAFAFLAVSFGGMSLLAGLPGVLQLVTSASVAVTDFAFLPIPLFLLMGELLFHTGIAARVFDAVYALIGRLRGRPSWVTVAGGTAYAALSGTSMGNTALLGALLVPEMTRRGYKPQMSMGPILATSGLAILIPPSSLAVLLGSIAKIDIGRLLIAGVLPGLLLAGLFALTIVQLLRLDPAAAPDDVPRPRPLAEKLVVGLTRLLPMGFIVFLVIGLILMGVATPTEAAAFGVLGVLIVAEAFRSLSSRALRRSLEGALKASAMVLLIVIASSTFAAPCLLGRLGGARAQRAVAGPLCGCDGGGDVPDPAADGHVRRTGVDHDADDPGVLPHRSGAGDRPDLVWRGDASVARDRRHHFALRAQPFRDARGGATRDDAGPGVARGGAVPAGLPDAVPAADAVSRSGALASRPNGTI